VNVKKVFISYSHDTPEHTSLVLQLADARRLIEKHGYRRRKEELEDAEAAILPCSS